ncbi:hypothetical protein LUZ60_004640 [Juncus effusus]|nr:hypothetical protein LUZ60_004640 [Juncus effusus]
MGEVVCIEETTTAASTLVFEKTYTIQKSKKEEETKPPKIEEIKEKKVKEKCRHTKKCELVRYDDLPEYLKDNEFILGYYRSEWPMKETICSIFSIHNETLNVWSHLLGFFIFLCLTIFTAMVIPRINGPSIPTVKNYFIQVVEPNSTEGKLGHIGCLIDLDPDGSKESSLLRAHCTSWPLTGTRDFQSSLADDNCTNYTCGQTSKLSHTISAQQPEPITRWPLFAFLVGAMFCLMTSSICHLISCHSEQTAYISLRLDYTGISALIVTSFYPLVFYSFLCDTFYRHLYIGFITTFGFATILVSLVPIFQTPAFRSVRAVLFSCMGVSGLVPIIHKFIWFHHQPEVVVSTVYEAFMGIFYGLGVTIYAARIPERWFPGRFDVVGHSHQLFHLFVIAGAYTHYLSGLEYLKWRDVKQCW